MLKKTMLNEMLCLFSTKEKNVYINRYPIFYDWAVYKSHNGGMIEPAWQCMHEKQLTFEGQKCGPTLISITVVRLATSLFPARAFNNLLYLHNSNSWHLTCKFRIPVSASIIHSSTKITLIIYIRSWFSNPKAIYYLLLQQVDQEFINTHNYIMVH